MAYVAVLWLSAYIRKQPLCLINYVVSIHIFVARQQLHRLLAFWTGLRFFPILGFNPPFTIQFSYDEDQPLPYANIRANILTLPTAVGFDESKLTMDNCLDNGFLFINE